MFTIKLFLSLIPIIIIAVAMYKIDIDKEPKKVLRQIFISSIVIGLIGGLISSYLTKFIDTLNFNSIFVYNIVKYFFIVAFIEEICKFIPAKLIGMKSKYHTSYFDTLLYFTFAGLGFACIENIMYVMTFTIKTAFIRGLLSVPGHILFSVILGIFIGLANREKLINNNKTNEKSIIYTTLGFVISSGVHALFNIGLTLKTDILKALVVTTIYLLGIYIIFIIKETSKVNSFYIKNIIFKKVLDIRFIKTNRNIIGIVSSMIIMFGLFNTFTVYTFVEKYIYIKYLLIIIQFIFIILILYKNKLNDKFKYLDITKIISLFITICIYLFLIIDHLKNNTLGYGYTLVLIGILFQFIYFLLDFIKIKDKQIVKKKELPKEVENTSLEKQIKENNKEIIDEEII